MSQLVYKDNNSMRVGVRRLLYITLIIFHILLPSRPSVQQFMIAPLYREDQQVLAISLNTFSQQPEIY